MKTHIGKEVMSFSGVSVLKVLERKFEQCKQRVEGLFTRHRISRPDISTRFYTKFRFLSLNRMSILVSFVIYLCGRNLPL